MSIPPEGIQGREIPEPVTPETTEAIITQMDALLTGQQVYEGAGRAFEFVTDFEGELTFFMVQLQPVEASLDGSSGGVTVHPADSPAADNSTKFALMQTENGVQLKKLLPVDLSDFLFEDAPETEFPPYPEPDENGNMEFTEEYYEAIAAAKAATGFDIWERRYNEAKARYIAEKRAADEALGLDMVYEPQAQELLRALEAGGMMLRQQQARAEQYQAGRRSSIAGWLGSIARQAINWLKGN